MEVFKGNDNNNKKGFSSFDIHNEGKHLFFSMGDLEFLTVGLFYDDINKKFNIEEYFTIEKNDENKEINGLLDKFFLSYSGDVYFTTEGAGLVLERDAIDNYCFHFFRDFEEKNNMIKSKLIAYTQENNSMYRFYKKIQENNLEMKTRQEKTTDSLTHQIDMDEYLESLEQHKKIKKPCEKNKKDQ